MAENDMVLKNDEKDIVNIKRYDSIINIAITAEQPIKPILKGGDKIPTRILYPLEYSKLRNATPVKYQNNLDVLLCTGMRYVEAKMLQKNPDWYDETRKFIQLPQGIEKKKRQVFKQRYIKLSNYGNMQMRSFFKGSRLPAINNWTVDLKRWMNDAGLSDISLSAKTLRKTWESWLMMMYPENQMNILLNQGHTSSVSINHYISLPFNESDKRQMSIFTSGIEF
jgi:integrase